MENMMSNVVMSDETSTSLIAAMSSFGFRYIDSASISSEQFAFHMPVMNACSKSWFFHMPDTCNVVQVIRNHYTYYELGPNRNSYWAVNLIFESKSERDTIFYIRRPVQTMSRFVALRDTKRRIRCIRCTNNMQGDKFYAFYYEDNSGIRTVYSAQEIVESVCDIFEQTEHSQRALPFTDPDLVSLSICDTSYAFPNSRHAFFAQLDAQKFSDILSINLSKIW